MSKDLSIVQGGASDSANIDRWITAVIEDRFAESGFNSQWVSKMSRFLSILILVLVPVQASAYFKCTNEEGGVTFQQLPCPAAANQIEQQVRGEHKSGNPVLTATRVDKTSSVIQKFTEEFFDDTPNSLAANSMTLSRISSAVASLSPLKSILTQYQAVNGRWPEKFSDIGFSERELTSSQIDEVILEAEGVIVAKLNASAGDGKYIALQPRYVLGGTTIEWACFANFTKRVLDQGGSRVCKSRVIR